MWHAFFVSGVFVTEKGNSVWLQGIVALQRFPQDQAGYHEIQIAAASLHGQAGHMNIYCLTPMGMVPAPEPPAAV
jgi:hypothetical protein